jgi:hypothetical protein
MTVDMVWDRSSLMVLIISSAIDSKAQSNGANPLISMSICLRTKKQQFIQEFFRKNLLSRHLPNVVDVEVIDRYSSSYGVDFEREEKVHATD